MERRQRMANVLHQHFHVDIISAAYGAGFDVAEVVRMGEARVGFDCSALDAANGLAHQGQRAAALGSVLLHR